MGKPTGFIEYLRELPLDRSPSERVGDWKEFHHHMDDKHLRQQAARCMDCGIPFCHQGCPLGNVIPEFNDLVWKGRVADAAQGASDALRALTAAAGKSQNTPSTLVA